MNPGDEERTLVPAVRHAPRLASLRVRGTPRDEPVTAPDPAAASPDEPPTPPPDFTSAPVPDSPSPQQRVFTTVPPRGSGPSRRFGGLRIALASLLRERRRLLLSTLIVALGIAYLAGSLSLLGRVSQGLADLSGVGTEKSDLVLEGAVAFDSPLEQVRQLIPDGLRNSVSRIPGVKATDPRVEDTVVLVDSAGKPLVQLGITERPSGANWPTVAALNPYQLLAGGRAPTGAREVVIDRATATRGGLQVGDSVGVSTKTTDSTATIVGLVTLGDKDLPPGSSLALFDTDTARTLFQRGTDDNSIGIQLDQGADVDAVTARIQSLLPPNVELTDAATFEQHRETSLAKSFSLITVLLVGFAALALVVGAFTVANSNALLFARRRNSFALLRLVGASPRQLLTAALSEAALVGAIAVAIGIPLGLLVGRLIESLMGSLGAPIPTAGPSVTAVLIFACLVVGIGVTVFTAVLPARDAARVAPIVAVTQGDDRSTANHPWFRFFGWASVGAIIGGGMASRLVDGSTALALGAAGGAVAVVALSFIPRLLTGLVAGTTRLFVGRSTALRSLVALRSRSARTRAASTTAALLMATFVVASLSTLSSSFVASIDRQVSDTLTADAVVDSGTWTRGGLPSALVFDIGRLPGVDAYSGLRVGRARIGTVDSRLVAMNGADMFRLVNLGDPAGTKALTPNGIALSDVLARQIGVTRGSTLTLGFSNTAETVTVESIFTRRSALLGDAIIDTALLARTTPSSIDIVALVKFDAGASAAALPKLTALASRYGVEQVLAPSQLIDRRTEVLRGFEQVIQWMLIFSVLLAVVGVANTLQLGVNERRRELGLLRAVGGSRRQVVRIVLVEAIALSSVGVVLGTLLGVGAAVAAVSALGSLGLEVIAVPWAVVVGTALAATALGVVGAWIPAVRAARTGIMDAIGGGPEARSSTNPGTMTRFLRRRRSPSVEAETSRISDMYSTSRPLGDPPDAAGFPGDTEDTEDPMAARCYNCGNEPGTEDECQVCGASQIPEPLGMFSTSPLADAVTTPARVEERRAPSMPGAGLWSRGEEQPTDDESQHSSNGNGHVPASAGYEAAAPRRYADIVDAAVIEDDELEPDDMYASVPPTTPSPVTPSATPTTGPQPLGSIFDDMENTASPFARHANDEDEFPPEVEERRSPKWSAPWAPPAQHAVPTAFAAPTYAAPTYAAPSPPPTQQHQAQAPVAGSAPVAPSGPPLAAVGSSSGSDDHGLSAAVARLSPEAQHSGAVAFSVVGALITREEAVLSSVSGWSSGLPTVVVLTTSRLLVVGDRRFNPVVEVFALRPSLTIFGQHLDGSASITFQDTDRVLTVDQIPDVAVAIELANATRTRTNGVGF